MLFKQIQSKSALLLLVAGMFAGAAGAADRYVLISHAPDSDSWWNTIKNAIAELKSGRPCGPLANPAWPT